MSSLGVEAGMSSIWKFSLDVNDDIQPLGMPQLSTVKHVAMQNGKVCLWSIVMPGSPIIKRSFRVRGTGHPFSHLREEYIGSVQDGPFVWHVLEQMR